jgi:hypothetical protein
MSEEQEARVLSNQALIMKALAVLVQSVPSGGGHMKGELDLRVRDTEAFIAEYLHGEQP